MDVAIGSQACKQTTRENRIGKNLSGLLDSSPTICQVNLTGHPAVSTEKGYLMLNILVIVAGLLALIGIVGLIGGALAKEEKRKQFGLRTLQVCMTLAGLLLIASPLLGNEIIEAAYGLMLIIFGTGVTAYGKRKV
jgi:uncharacterized membrane protein HdeD (DUF308 family)